MWWTCFSRDSRHCNGNYVNYLCFTACWHIPLLTWGWLYGGSYLEEGTSFREILGNQFLLYRWRVVLNNSCFWDCLNRIFPKELDVKNTADTHIWLTLRNRWNWNLMTKRNDFSFRIVNLLSSVAIFPQHLRMELSYHNPYVMAELAETMRTSLYRARFLTVRLLE